MHFFVIPLQLLVIEVMVQFNIEAASFAHSYSFTKLPCRLNCTIDLNFSCLNLSLVSCVLFLPKLALRVFSTASLASLAVVVAASAFSLAEAAVEVAVSDYSFMFNLLIFSIIFIFP